MLDTVFNLSNDAYLDQTDTKPLRRKLNSLTHNDEIDEDKIVQQDVLLWGLCSRSNSSTFNSTFSKRHILLYPNRLELPGKRLIIKLYLGCQRSATNFGLKTSC